MDLLQNNYDYMSLIFNIYNFLNKTVLQIWILISLAHRLTKISMKIEDRRRIWKPTIFESKDGILCIANLSIYFHQCLN